MRTAPTRQKTASFQRSTLTVNDPERPAGEERLFACGTLRRGEANEMARYFHQHASWLGEGRFQGRLYTLGWCPGAVLSDDPGDRVLGDAFALHPAHAAEVLARLDEYEGDEYERREVEVTLGSGRTVRCWAYLYVGGLEGGALIASGDWLAFQAETGGNN
jgi:gamma-glutamylcyclotransferase (GGCT)/AIG2-like uncharacterized protein YtfP